MLFSHPKKTRSGRLLSAIAIASLAVVGLTIYSRLDFVVIYPGLTVKGSTGADDDIGPDGFLVVPDMDFKMPPILQPKIVLRALALLDDDQEIIGINIAGKHRAYALTAMNMPATHVVNDLLGAQPVTVTYCDKTECIKVFTGGPTGSPLDVFLSGWRKLGSAGGGGMVLTASRQRYLQRSGQRVDASGGAAFPYAEMPFVRSTWKAWSEAHPDTDLFDGGTLAIQ